MSQDQLLGGGKTRLNDVNTYQKTIPEIEETTEPKKIKLKAEDAYCYITNLLKTKEGFEKLKKTAIWTSVKNAADKQGISPKIFDEKYN